MHAFHPFSVIAESAVVPIDGSTSTDQSVRPVDQTAHVIHRAMSASPTAGTDPVDHLVSQANMAIFAPSLRSLDMPPFTAPGDSGMSPPLTSKWSPWWSPSLSHPPDRRRNCGTAVQHLHSSSPKNSVIPDRIRKRGNAGMHFRDAPSTLRKPCHPGACAGVTPPHPGLATHHL